MEKKNNSSKEREKELQPLTAVHFDDTATTERKKGKEREESKSFRCRASTQKERRRRKN